MRASSSASCWKRRKKKKLLRCNYYYILTVTKACPCSENVELNRPRHTPVTGLIKHQSGRSAICYANEMPHFCLKL